MKTPTQPPSTRRSHLIVAVLLILSLTAACAAPTLPWVATPTPSSLTPQPTSAAPKTLEPLPPTLIETTPFPGAELPLDGSFTLFFDQSMDKNSVEGALEVQPALGGRFSWTDADSTLVFTPDQPFSPASQVGVTLKETAKAANGLNMLSPVSLTFQTVGKLRLTQVLPASGTKDVDPSSAVVAVFNRPVVALGADPAELPPAFDLEPSAPGRSEWLNTSTYIFYPDPALSGGVTYNALLNLDLVAVDGATLDLTSQADPALTNWTFVTALPSLIKIEPDPELPIALDAPLVLTFNQPMDQESLAANLSLKDPGGISVPGAFSWNPDFTQVSFQPEVLLPRSSQYSLSLEGQTRSQGGTVLGSPYTTVFTTVPNLSVIATTPLPNEELPTYGDYASLSLHFSTPIQAANIARWVTFVPAVTDLYTYLDEAGTTLYLSGVFKPSRGYTLILSPDVTDLWGQNLGRPYVLYFRTAPAQPELFLNPDFFNNHVIFLKPGDPYIGAQATNLQTLSITSGTVPPEDFFQLITSRGYEALPTYTPQNPQSWTQALQLPANQSESVNVSLTPNNVGLAPGLYYFSIQSPELLQRADRFPNTPLLAVVSQTHLTLKVSATDALVWVVHLEDQTPLADAQVKLVEEDGSVLAEGTTNADGLFQTSIPQRPDPYRMVYAVVNQPGDPSFGMALSNWNMGLSSWDFNIPSDYTGPGPEAYVYTDRPIYRPGQTVYFRAVIRQENNGRYSLPDRFHQIFELYGVPDTTGQVPLLSTLDLPLSSYGTTHGSFTLPSEAAPGDYHISLTDLPEANIYFQVADYRKPEIDLEVSLSPQEIKLGDPIQAQVSARYYFGAPAGNLPVHWALYRSSDPFLLPQNSVGLADTQFINPYGMPDSSALGLQIAEGSAETRPDGSLEFEVPPPEVNGSTPPQTYRYTLEVTIQDSSTLEVSSRAEIRVHPTDVYIGLRPESWSGQAGNPLSFTIATVNWDRTPTAVEDLRATFQKVTWTEVSSDNQTSPGISQLVPEYTPQATTDFFTDLKGVARLEFTPSEPGIYMLDVVGGSAQSQVTVWVRGESLAAWPEIPNQHLQLSADAGQDPTTAYTVGQTARIFIPNPFNMPASALITVERDQVMRSQVLQVGVGGYTLDLPILEEDAPNIYVSVTLLGDANTEFRQGYTTLYVKPEDQTLNVEIMSSSPEAKPGDRITLDMRVTNAQGQPVRGEFSLALVDEAALALANPNAPGIVAAFYSHQPLGVQTSLSLAAYGARNVLAAGGQGGGGGGMPGPTLVFREDFQDTAFWNGEITTDANGMAQVSLTLPDNLTTWRADLRGVTADTRVGESITQVVVSKDLMISPVTPRFLVAGDHIQMAAVVHNNTMEALEGTVTLQASGFTLDDASLASQEIEIAPGGQKRVTWWGKAQEEDDAELLFSVSAGTYQDGARPADGLIPILNYSSPQTFATAGMLSQAGERLEVVSLPRSFTPTGGELRVDLSSSFTALVIAGINALEQTPYLNTEPVLARALPALLFEQAVAVLGPETVASNLPAKNTLQERLTRLVSMQNANGGWGWAKGGQSNPYITAYILFGLNQAVKSGYGIDPTSLSKAQEFLQASLVSPDIASAGWELDRLAFIHFSLVESGSSDLIGVETLYAKRDLLSPWAQAMLLLALETLSPGDERSITLISDIEASAIRSSTGAHWEEQTPIWRNLGTPTTTTAVVVYSLAQRHPASELLPDAIRHLVSNRRADGMWASTYESSWALMALIETLKGTGDIHSEYAFSSVFNEAVILEGQTEVTENLISQSVTIPFEEISPDSPNALRIRRGAGAGRLYYAAYLELFRPVDSAPAIQNGMSIERRYYLSDQDCRQAQCEPVDQVSLAAAGSSEMVDVHLTLTIPDDAYNIVVEDHIPAGAEILNTRLLTSQQGAETPIGLSYQYDAADPFNLGWGWWYFDTPQISRDRIQWTAESLPAGTYVLTYTLVPYHPGEYHLVPARAWQYYFPEVQGSSAGAVFTIKE